MQAYHSARVQWGWETFEAKFLKAERVSELQRLQLELLRSGYRMLRPTGFLVYSTCRFASARATLYLYSTASS